MAQNTANQQPATPGWNGEFTLTLQRNVSTAKTEREELDDFMASKCYDDAPPSVRIAVMWAWHRAGESLALHRDCIASFCEPWFDASAFGSAA
jgi:hypothetical protein